MSSLPNITFALLLALSFGSLVKLSTARSFRFSPVLLFFTLFLLQQALGCMFMARVGNRSEDLARAGLQLGTVGLVLGVAAVSVLTRFQPSQELSSIRSRLDFDEPALAAKVIVLIAGYCLSSLIMIWFFQQSGGMPLFEGVHAMLSGNEALAAQQLLKEKRMELTYFEGSSYRGQGYVDQLRMTVLPYVFGCFLLYALRARRRFKTLALLSGGPVVVFLLGTGQRHPTLAFLMVMTIIGYTISSPATHRKLLGGFLLGGVGVFFVLTYLLGRYTHTDSLTSDLSMVALGLWNRVAYSNALGTMAVFDLFPNPEPYRFGMTWISDLKGFLPGPYVAFSAWLFRRLYGFTGTASPMCFGEMYANFGLAGIFIGSTVVGAVLQTMQVVWARRSRYRAESVVIYAMVSMAFARWAMGGLLGPLQFGLFALPMLYACIRVGQIFVIGLVTAVRRSLHWRAQHPAAVAWND